MKNFTKICQTYLNESLHKRADIVDEQLKDLINKENVGVYVYGKSPSKVNVFLTGKLQKEGEMYNLKSTEGSCIFARSNITGVDISAGMPTPITIHIEA